MSAHIDPLLAEMIAAGLISPDDAMTAPSLNVTLIDDADALDVAEQIEAEEAFRTEVYTSQEPKSDFVETAARVLADDELQPYQEDAIAEIDATPAPRKARAAKAAAAPKAPKVPSLKGTVSLGEYVASFAGEIIVLDDSDPEATEIATLINGINATKIRDKAVSIFQSMYGKGKMSIFAKIAFEQLALDGFVSNASLVNQFHVASATRAGVGYSIGTARSQAQQMVSLFRTLKVTDQAGNININSSILGATSYYRTHQMHLMSKAAEAA